MIWTLLVGLIVGAIAKLLMPGKDPGGWVITMLIGVAGSLLASFIGTQVGWYQPEEAAGFIAAIVGAVILLALYRAFLGRKHHLTRT